jgi:2,3-bisphosphoglycerate-independent phosphoglycerate mutase
VHDLAELPTERIATVVGRYYAMDRDRRWERTQRAYDAIVDCTPTTLTDPVAYLQAQYDAGVTDEFVEPVHFESRPGIEPGDSVVFFNFRPDRARQLTRALGEPDFDEFDRGEAPDVRLTTLTEYLEDWSYPVAFPQARPEVTLASFLAKRGLRQLHVAETEKYAHVTYFLNGGEEDEYEGEGRRLVDSPRDVPTYDKKPEMSAPAATDAFVDSWREGDYAFGIINFANPDMVGHTGVIPAAVRAVETVDGCLARVVEAVEGTGGGLRDHRRSRQRRPHARGGRQPQHRHSMNPVPLIVTTDVGELREGGILADVAPTILRLLGLEQPPQMTGKPLFEQ